MTVYGKAFLLSAGRAALCPPIVGAVGVAAWVMLNFTQALSVMRWYTVG